MRVGRKAHAILSPNSKIYNYAQAAVTASLSSRHTHHQFYYPKNGGWRGGCSGGGRGACTLSVPLRIPPRFCIRKRSSPRLRFWSQASPFLSLPGCGPGRLLCHFPLSTPQTWCASPLPKSHHSDGDGLCDTDRLLSLCKLFGDMKPIRSLLMLVFNGGKIHMTYNVIF